MKIFSINNINVQNTQFRAKFPKQDINEFIRETAENDIDIVPKLYTMLDIIKKHPAKEAEIEHIGLWHRILLDGESVSGKSKYFCAIHALFDSTVKSKTSQLKETPIKRLSEDEFEIEYYKNSKKTIKDIKNDF